MLAQVWKKRHAVLSSHRTKSGQNFAKRRVLHDSIFLCVQNSEEVSPFFWKTHSPRVRNQVEFTLLAFSPTLEEGRKILFHSHTHRQVEKNEER